MFSIMKLNYCCSEYGTRSPSAFPLYYYGYRKELLRHSEMPLLRVGRMVIYRTSSAPLKEPWRASSYVASYVNCDSKFPVFLKTYFKPKHSYSKDFGCNNRLFQLDKILEKFSRGHLTYFKQVDKQAIPTIVECPYPKYIIHRFFPKFKGYSRVAPFSQCELMERFAKFDFSQGVRLEFIFLLS